MLKPRGWISAPDDDGLCHLFSSRHIEAVSSQLSPRVGGPTTFQKNLSRGSAELFVEYCCVSTPDVLQDAEVLMECATKVSCLHTICVAGCSAATQLIPGW